MRCLQWLFKTHAWVATWATFVLMVILTVEVV